MKTRITPYLLALALALLLPTLLPAQQVEPGLKVPPALVGSHGRVLVGTQAGKIFRAVDGPNNTLTVDTSSAGLPLPAGVSAVWTLSQPNSDMWPDLVVGLVSYMDETSNNYGIIRSDNFGESWTLSKPAAFVSPIFTPSNTWYTQPLGEFVWLDDGLHGWVWGRYGIVKTEDGGLTWTLVRALSDGPNSLWALDFKSPSEGVGVIGELFEMYYNRTTDSGRTWTRAANALRPKRIVQVDYIGSEYRAFVFDRFSPSDNSYMFFSPDGINYPAPPSSHLRIQREQTPMSEMLWADSLTGFMVLRSGDVLRNDSAGRGGLGAWEYVHIADSAAYPVPIGPSIGWGQRSILLDRTAIVHVSTIRNTGEIYRLLKWPVALSSVPREHTAPADVDMALVPNPTSGRTEVSIDLKRPSALRLRVVDLLGREYLRQDLPVAGVGTAHIDLDLAGIPSGAYRCVIDGDNLHADRPLLIVH